MDLIGQTLGQYRIIESIGAGGMATVFKAYQPGLDRYVAVKVLPAQHALTPGFKERFFHEARAVAQLSHPNILPIHDVGIEGDISYFAMKYVPGHTLKDLMGRSMALSSVSYFIDQIAGALDHAHESGILHRDIKPVNMLLEDSWLLLADFGLAKIVEGSIALTGTGAIMGTPAYMSPEQAESKSVDKRTDIYSLGIVMYEMVTGRVPFEGETPLGVVIKHIHEPLPLPRSLNPELPEGVERVILKALAKNPAERYDRAGDLAEALRQAAGISLGQPVAPPPVSEPQTSEASETLPDEPDETLPAQLGKSLPDKTIESLPTPGPVRGWFWPALGAVLLVVIVGAALAYFAFGGSVEQPDGGVVPSGSLSEQSAAVAGNSAEAVTETPQPPTSTPDAGATNTAIAVGSAATQTAAIPTTTDTPVPPETATPQPPTSTPTPQPTTLAASTVADNARAFAEPILATIVDRPPDHEDDFSDPNSGWWISTSNEGDAWGYETDEYFILAQGVSNFGVRSDRLPSFSDFVFEVEGRFVSGDWGHWNVLFRDSQGAIEQPIPAHYGASLWSNGDFRLHKNVNGEHIELINTPVSNFESGLDSSRLTIIAQGPQIGVYINGEPVWLQEDESSNRGELSIGIGNETSGAPLRVQFDNFKIWDISDLNPDAPIGDIPTPSPTVPTATPQPPSTSTPDASASIIASIAARPPDYEDNFDDPASGWPAESGGRGEWGYRDGAYFILQNQRLQQDCCLYVGTLQIPSLSDFVLDVDARFVSGESGTWGVQFRQSHATIDQPNADGTYGVMFSPSGTFRIWKYFNNSDIEMRTGSAQSFKPGTETNNLRIITKGSQISVYMNGDLVSTVNDESLSQGTISLRSENFTNTAIQIQFDNLKIWDISKIQ